MRISIFPNDSQVALRMPAQICGVCALSHVSHSIRGRANIERCRRTRACGNPHRLLLASHPRAKSTSALLQSLSRMKGQNASCRSDALGRLALLWLAQLATHPGKSFSQVGVHAFRVAKRRIEDGLHVASTLVTMSKALPPSMSQEAFLFRANCVGSATYCAYLGAPIVGNVKRIDTLTRRWATHDLLQNLLAFPRLSDVRRHGEGATHRRRAFAVIHRCRERIRNPCANGGQVADSRRACALVRLHGRGAGIAGASCRIDEHGAGVLPGGELRQARNGVDYYALDSLVDAGTSRVS